MSRILKIVTSIIILITASVFSLEINESEEYLKDLLINKYEIDINSHTIEVLKNPFMKSSELPKDVKFIAISQKEPIGLFSARLEYTNGGTKIKYAQVKYQIRKFQYVAVITDKISRNKVLSPDDVVIERKNVTQLRERPVLSFDDIDGLRTKRNLKKGQILTHTALEKVPNIFRGNIISISYGNESFRIEAEGVALQEGSIGDIIKVKNTSSGKILQVKVIDNNSVKAL